MTTDISSPTKTTGSSDPTSSPIQLLNFTFLFISSISTERSVTYHTPLTSSYVPKWHSSEPLKQELGGLMTGLIVVSLLLILVGFSILVIGLIRKRYITFCLFSDYEGRMKANILSNYFIGIDYFRF